MSTPWIIGTGFSRGIGLELAKQMKSYHYNILHIGRTHSEYEDEFLDFDLSRLPSTDFFQTLQEKLKDKNIFGFFYSAGLFPKLTYENNNSKQKVEFWESQTKTMQVNYLSCIALLEEVLPHILSSKKINENLTNSSTPFIAHFSSLAAVDPLPALEFYGITKMATLKYFEDLAKRFQSNKLCSFSIHPGTVNTDMVEGIMSSDEHQHLPVVQIFHNARTENKLLSAQESAKLVADFLFQKKNEPMRTLAHGKLYLADTGKIF